MTNAAEQISRSAPNNEIDLATLAGVVWRGKWIIILFGIIGVLLAGYYGTRVAVPMYPATTTIALNDEGQQQLIGDIESIFSGGGTDTSAINTEIEVMRSRRIIGQLVDELNLVADPEFNGFRETPPLLARIRTLVSDYEWSLREGEALRNAVIDTIISRVRISNIRQSLAFNITIETTDAEKSAEIANTLAEIYIANQINLKLDEATRAIEFLSQRTSELQINVEELEQNLAQQMEASDVIDGDLLLAQNLQLRDLRERIEAAQISLAEDQSLLSAIDEAGDFSMLLQTLENFDDGRFSGIIQRFRAGRLGQQAAQIAFEGIIDDVGNDIRRTQTQLSSLQSSASELSIQITAQSNELIQMQQLDREVETARLLYQTFFTRLQEASVQQGLETADARVLSIAVPRNASSPRILVMAVLAGLLGGLLGMAVAFFKEWRFSGFRTADEVRNQTGAKVFGTLPALAIRGRKQILACLKNKPNSVYAEAIRNLRTSILMANPDQDPQVILVTSSVPAEGKTTLSLSMARYFGSLENKRVLLVEADIRRQTLREYTEEARTKEAKLLDILLGKSRLEDLDLNDPELGVEVLMGSGGEFNAADLFESRRFKELIEKIRGIYDYIIIDSPPVLAVPDARVLTRYADLTVFVTRWGFTTRTQLKQGLEMLNSIGHPADGVVLTQVNQRKMKSYGYSGQYGYDDYSSGYYAHK